MNAYVYVATGQSRDVRRDAREGARVAVQFPSLGRCVELQVDQNGRWCVLEGPSAGRGGEFAEAARGALTRAAVA